MPQLDIDFVRAQFPAFAEPSLAGHAYFENAGGSYACAPVIARLDRFYRTRKLQPYGASVASRAAGDEMDEARTRLAAFMGVGAEEVNFGPSTSQNTYVLAQAFRGLLGEGDAVVVTDQDHEANSGAWRRLAENGVEIREWRMDPDTGRLDPEALVPLLDERVRLVAFPHCSNIVGEVNPVARISALVHAAGAVVCVDGVSHVPHGFPDITALDADIYLFSSYKTYGPHQGIMVIRSALAERLPNQTHFFNAGYLSKRLVPAGPDHAQIAACAGMADYIDALHAHHYPDEAAPAVRAARVHALQTWQEARLLAPLLDYLRGRNDVRVIGPDRPEGRVGTVALLHARPAIDLVQDLAPHGIIAGGGDFYAVRCLQALGIDPAHGVLRLSLVHYTHPDEITQAIRALDAVL